MTFKSNFFGSFAAGLFIPPNTIDFDKVFASFSALLAQSPHVLIVMCSLFVLYFLFLIWARRKDNQDDEKWEYTHLIENDRYDRGKYLLSVYTGVKSPAKTTAKLFVVLYGKNGQTQPKVLMDGRRENFTRGAVNNFVLTTPETIGKVTHLHIWHEETKSSGDYFLEKVVVYDILRRERSHYFCNQWLSMSRGDRARVRFLASADFEGMNDFNLLLTNNASKRLFDNHLWFSVAKRPTPSRLSRVERLTICIVVLFLCMVSNAMWFTESEDTTTGIQVGPIRITFRQLWVGLVSSVLVVPPTLIILEVFKRGKPRNSCTSIFPTERIDGHQENKSLEKGYEKFYSALRKLITKETQNSPRYKKKDAIIDMLADLQFEMEEEKRALSFKGKRKSKPVRFPWWAVIFGYVLAFLAVFTSAFFTLLYSLDWGPEKSTDWLLSLIFSLTQSIALTEPLKVLLVAVLMACLLKMPGDEEEEEDMVIAEHAPPKGSLFIIVINRDKNFYRQNHNLQNSLQLVDIRFAKVQRIETIFSWLNDTIFPAVFPTEDYNGDPYTEVDDLAFIRDMRGLRLGPLLLRQLRAKESWVASAMSNASRVTQAFVYSAPSSRNDLTVYGHLDHYEAGGYMVEINSAQDSVHTLTSLKDLNWIDRLTRAVIVELTVNNANVNVFSMVRIIVELPAMGGIFIKKELVSFRPYPYVEPFDFVLLIVQVIWALLVIALLGTEVVKMVKLKKQYFRQSWHYIVLGDLCLAFTSMVCFVLRTVYIIRAVEDVKNSGGHFVGFDRVAIWDNAYTVTIAIDLFLATLQLFRPLTFNKHLAIVQSALNRAFIAVTTYMFIFGILLFSYAQALNLVSGQVISAFRTLPFAMLNLFGVMLGVLKYSHIMTAESFLARMFFTAFTMTMNFIILNMFISIINDGLTEVKGNEELQDYDEELAEHVWTKLGSLVRAIFRRKDNSALSDEIPAAEGSPEKKVDATLSPNPRGGDATAKNGDPRPKKQGHRRHSKPKLTSSRKDRKQKKLKICIVAFSQKGRRSSKIATENKWKSTEEKLMQIFNTYSKNESLQEKWRQIVDEIRFQNRSIKGYRNQLSKCQKSESDLQRKVEPVCVKWQEENQSKLTEREPPKKFAQNVDCNSVEPSVQNDANVVPSGITPLESSRGDLARAETQDEVKTKKTKKKLKKAVKEAMQALSVLEQMGNKGDNVDNAEGKKKTEKKQRARLNDTD
ncbi:polycystic kidney disease protein 1-like 2 [Lingula anatina]|uniref:Polycystic kidney disease protein 1-like 2 n=1 Tax=Lingula anatina TaxID=7574 RepID=A0A1S3I1Q1_LINAN|nr:polycystic kidney disease protein 1-like 2 [Lingula anatina]|eukprot:XP_013391756.1 polycystic kidney disease protein 1-like 2 [Lingula anatina]